MSRLANRGARLIGAALCIASMQLPTAMGQQQSPPAVEAVMQRVNEIRRSGEEHDNPLAELTAFEKLDAEYRSVPNYPGNTVLTMVYEMQSFLGNHPAALRAYDERYDRYAPGYRAAIKDSASASLDLANLQAAPALAALDQLADDAQVIMINEAHHVPFHRTFTEQALTLLRKKGFTHFAAETFDAEDVELAKRGYPVLKTGRYTREPVFAEMVRTAIRAGYELVAYEHIGDGGIDEREQGQARNLIERVLERNPKAKLVVHAGYAHINERDEPKRMAQYFKQWSGIDPLTIDQTEMTERSSPDYEDPLYDRVLQKYAPKQTTVLRKAGGDLWSLDPGKYDVTVIHPRTTYENGRPTWLKTLAGRKTYELPNRVCGTATSCLVRARFVSESDAAVAVDQIEVKADQVAQATLLLPPGEFNIDVEDAAGKRLEIFKAQVSATRK